LAVPIWLWILTACLTALLAVLGVLSAVPSPAANPLSNILYALGRGYSRAFHTLRATGAERVPATGPVVIVANHTAGVDPILISAACPRPIRWVMAQDMRIGWLEWFWRWQKVIFVGRDTPDSAPAAAQASAGREQGGIGLREAIAHLKAGGVIGIFPEGGLERPPKHLLPFRPGVGLLIRRGGAVVVPVFIDGTPQVDPAWSSLWRRSRSTLEFLEPVNYTTARLGAAEIARDLQDRFVARTGWGVVAGPQGELPAECVPSKSGRRKTRAADAA
jgi:1-acyl-sn-glycerol-3-phosphate acyltransferase